MKAQQAEKYLRYQDLCRTYSRLALSRDSDHTMAIDGLQKRVLEALDARGGYGIFDEGNKGRGSSRGRLRRSLLWRRGAENSTMTRIQFPRNEEMSIVPTWSWMSCKGGIDYISPEYGDVEWQEMASPWSSSLKDMADDMQSDIEGADITLIAYAQDYELLDLRNGPREIIFDRPGGSQQSYTRCVVLGKQKSRMYSEDGTHYVLVIEETTQLSEAGNRIHERVGAGSLPGNCIKAEKTLVMIR
ncbi:hypothetical protein CTRI78_v007064 [Colletotrichum trifolii]|uniref:Uncharacterized protein n=1 Tax=Colletotrichum trifolii TaxID=5466 RepID=A0A4R8RA51_COLTR|nr:hypothetical protein CTRI78_v007064 [Colletotrichum trifolii]